jgi:hypothetical protein
MISSEVQRTLVKSPPELWAELSDPTALARHLGELGEIRIVRSEPESTIEWAAENTTGIVSIKPSGWGTKVTLSVTREVPAASAPETPPATEAPEPEPAAIVGATAEAVTARDPESMPPAATALEQEPITEAPPEPESMPEAAGVPGAQIEAEAAPEPESQLEPRRGFFARLFGRRRKAEPPASYEQEPTVEPHDAFAAVRQVLAPETFAAEHPFVAAPEVMRPTPEPTRSEPEPTATEPALTASGPTPDTGPEHADDISAELLAAEEAGTEEVTAVLTAVLDRLGAAHHRPFSRS